jgi:hypothetical protein
MAVYDIIPVPVRATKPLHEWLPSMHMMLVAPTGSGKTVLLLNLIARKVFPYRKFYHSIQVHSPTIETDNNWDVIRTERETKRGQYELYDHLDAEAIMSLVDYNDTMIKYKGKAKVPHSLIVLDDLAGMMKHRSNDFLSALLMRLRHSNLHLWLTTQSYRAIPRPMRLQFLFVVIFRVSPQELDVVSMELNGSLDEDVFRSLHRRAVAAKPYNFLYVDVRRQKYYSGFTDELVVRRGEKNDSTVQPPTSTPTSDATPSG